MKSTILIVEDEKLLLDSLTKALSKDGYRILAAMNGRDAMNLFDAHNPDLVLLDVKLPDIDGVNVLKKIKEANGQFPVIMMTAYSGIRGAVDAVKSGAYDYVAKPFDIEELKFIISRCLESQKVVAEVNQIRSTKKERYGFDKIITSNSQMKQIIKLCKRVASNSLSTVLLLGESGTGKELFANAIHYNGPRSDYRLITINCTAFSEGVLESELFGHEKGAFTGAFKQKKGMFEIADRGTLFLDEIGELSPKTQVKLLRFLEEKTIQKVGGTESMEVDVRIIAATNRDLMRAISEGRFREDLYYRLNVISISIPPLRARKDDIELLVDHFIGEYNRVLSKNIKGCSEETLKALLSYDWPGNVRELRNIIERVVLLSDGNMVTPSDLPLEIINSRGTVDKNALNVLDAMPLDKLVNLYTRNILERHENNRTKTAHAMGITRQRLRRILSSLSVD
jgi:DNA-binding NtrC family response regulator